MAVRFIGTWPFIKKSKRIVPFDFGSNTFTPIGSSIVEWDELIKDGKQDYKELLRAYNTLSEVASPYNFWAQNSGKVKFKTFIEKGKELEEIIDPNYSLNKLLTNPNQYLGWNEFKENNLVNYKLFGNCYINFIGEAVGTTSPTSMYLLPPQNIFIKLKGVDNMNKLSKDFREIEIDRYEFVIDTNQEITKPIPKEQILHLRAINPNYDNGSFLFGQSPLVSAQYAINSIYSGYSAKVGLYKNGPKTIFSLNPPNSTEFGSFELPDGPAVETEQKRMEKYGIEEGQFQSIISKLPLRADRISYNIGELQINKNNIRDFQTVCAAIGIDSRLLGDPSSSTFANQEEASKKFYQGPFVSYENAFFNDLTTKIRTYPEWAKVVIKPDFSNVPELADSEKDLQDILLPEVEKGLLTRNFYLMQRGMETKDIPKEFNDYAVLGSKNWQPLTQETNNTQDENI